MDALTKLIAINEIQQLKSRYFRLVDTRDWTALEHVYTRDAQFDASEALRVHPLNGPPEGEVGPVIHGNRAIVAWASRSLENYTSVHHGANHEVTIESETEASGVIAMVDIIRGSDRKAEIFRATGHYWESYRVEDGAWRIARSKLTRLTNDVHRPFLQQ